MNEWQSWLCSMPPVFFSFIHIPFILINLIPNPFLSFTWSKKEKCFKLANIAIFCFYHMFRIAAAAADDGGGGDGCSWLLFIENFYFCVVFCFF